MKISFGPKRMRSAKEPVIIAAVMTAKVPWNVTKSDSGRVPTSAPTMPWSQILLGPPTTGLPGSKDML
jgi:hypothetical protein